MTITDIARHAGVSKGAVSYALNGRPGLSDTTRARILKIADDLGWYPNSAARALSASRANACGLVLTRPARMLALEPFFMEFISGVEWELSARSIALTIQLAEKLEDEVAIYRRWWAERRVDGALLVDLRVEDPRLDELARLGLPAVVVGEPTKEHMVPAVWNDERSVVDEVVRYLAGLGHTRIARVAGLGSFVSTTMRTAAFRSVTRKLGLPSKVVASDFTPESGARATRQLLSDPEPPTAIVYDSDILAVTGLGVAYQLGFAVPDDLSIVAWDDSMICRVVHPPLTAVTRDIPDYGVRAARRLLAEIDGRSDGDVELPRGQLTPRSSTAPPPAGAAVPRPRRRS